MAGIFANSHLRYEGDRDKGANGMPSLQQMTLKALQILSKNPEGFLLVVRNGFYL
jgi:alkaline phosphatase